MNKYHITPAGDASPCHAQKRCPFGDIEADHYDNAEAARAAYEKTQQTLPAPKKYPKYSSDESMKIASTIKKQIGVNTLMALGSEEFIAIPGGLRFKARILPFTKIGIRSGSPSVMYVEVKLNGTDYYDVKVTRVVKYAAQTHFEQEDVDAASLSDVLYSLDYDGPEIRNPRI